ncbi:LOW QUALITY PROTEIN: hypothetical protein Cgig2_021425 [Carnegiea gigantea]|uniref:Chlorophyll a-b binding protein, chloroplastic n=1 Tax=Carnegiea gigantea TaxID=171969 RepID=A0A9Q1GIN2_9CARY|nr:LOW QUALITY PROTEIN: hypothetical protein Cgig2_021425 [Carnegiea gigantea]
MALAVTSTALANVPIREIPGSIFQGKLKKCMIGVGSSSKCMQPRVGCHSISLVALPLNGLMAGSDPELLRWFAQAELLHSRWAMVAVAGILIPESLESLGFNEDFDWFNGSREYFADPTRLFVVQLALMGWAEEWADYLNSGCENIEPKLPHKKNPKPMWGTWVGCGSTGESPLKNLSRHIANPGHCNIFTIMLQ